jgi:hypothetical protein
MQTMMGGHLLRFVRGLGRTGAVDADNAMDSDVGVGRASSTTCSTRRICFSDAASSVGERPELNSAEIMKR